jgi:hypothetical protein
VKQCKTIEEFRGWAREGAVAAQIRISNVNEVCVLKITKIDKYCFEYEYIYLSLNKGGSFETNLMESVRIGLGKMVDKGNPIYHYSELEKHLNSGVYHYYLMSPSSNGFKKALMKWKELQ